MSSGIIPARSSVTLDNISPLSALALGIRVMLAGSR